MMVLEVVAAGAPMVATLPGRLAGMVGVPVAIPEASSLALLICGLAAVGVAARRRRIRMDTQHNSVDANAKPDGGPLSGTAAAP